MPPKKKTKEQQEDEELMDDFYKQKKKQKNQNVYHPGDFGPQYKHKTLKSQAQQAERDAMEIEQREAERKEEIAQKNKRKNTYQKEDLTKYKSKARNYEPEYGELPTKQRNIQPPRRNIQPRAPPVPAPIIAPRPAGAPPPLPRPELDFSKIQNEWTEIQDKLENIRVLKLQATKQFVKILEQRNQTKKALDKLLKSGMSQMEIDVEGRGLQREFQMQNEAITQIEEQLKVLDDEQTQLFRNAMKVQKDDQNGSETNWPALIAQELEFFTKAMQENKDKQVKEKLALDHKIFLGKIAQKDKPSYDKVQLELEAEAGIKNLQDQDRITLRRKKIERQYLRELMLAMRTYRNYDGLIPEIGQTKGEAVDESHEFLERLNTHLDEIWAGWLRSGVDYIGSKYQKFLLALSKSLKTTEHNAVKSYMDFEDNMYELYSRFIEQQGDQKIDKELEKKLKKNNKRTEEIQEAERERARIISEGTRAEHLIKKPIVMEEEKDDEGEEEKQNENTRRLLEEQKQNELAQKALAKALAESEKQKGQKLNIPATLARGALAPRRPGGDDSDDSDGSDDSDDPDYEASFEPTSHEERQRQERILMEQVRMNADDPDKYRRITIYQYHLLNFAIKRTDNDAVKQIFKRFRNAYKRRRGGFKQTINYLKGAHPDVYLRTDADRTLERDFKNNPDIIARVRETRDLGLSHIFQTKRTENFDYDSSHHHRIPKGTFVVVSAKGRLEGEYDNRRDAQQRVKNLKTGIKGIHRANGFRGHV